MKKIIVMGMIALMTLSTLTAVSYTHLDVYKRQPISDAAA